MSGGRVDAGEMPAPAGGSGGVPTRAGELTAAAARRWGEREYARFGDTTLSFAGLHRWAATIAADLAGRGVRPGDRVLILLVNRLEVVAVTAAAWRIGAIAVPVVAIYRTHELAEIVRDSAPAAVVTAETLGERRPADELDGCLPPGRPVARYLVDPPSRSAPSGWRPLPGPTPAPASTEPMPGSAEIEPEPGPAVTEPQPGPEAPPSIPLPGPAAADRECLRLYTSGSTSTPKGVRLDSRTVIRGGRQFHDRLGLGESDVGLALAPLAHIAGLLAAALVPLTCGASAVILPRWDVHAAVELIHRHRVSWSLGAAVFLRDLVGEYERRRDEPAEPRHVLGHFVSGGADTAPELIERADALGMWAARTYGMTEAAGVVALARRDAPVHRRAHWDGELADGGQARVVDADGRELPPGTEGRILIRGGQLLTGYTDPALTAAQFDDQGWFDTGDLGIVAADRWVRITGRTKDIINRGGEKFSTADIEHVLHRHPDVAAAAVLGVPHERLGETVCAYVVPRRPGVTGAGLAEFLLGQDLARAKVPTEWHLVPELPTTASGKVQKHRLRAARDSAAAPVSGSAGFNDAVPDPAARDGASRDGVAREDVAPDCPGRTDRPPTGASR